MANLNIDDKVTGSFHYAAEFEQMKDFIDQPSLAGTTFDDSGTITIDETREYSSVRTVTGSTHTLTFATTGNLRGNYKKVRYTFDVDCTLTLTNLDATGSTLGTVNPIPAGTYDLWMFTSYGNVAMIIQNNTGTTPGTLDPPTLVFTAANQQINYTITGIDINATGGVLEYSTDNTNWTTWASYSFGTETGSITELTNDQIYYGRYRNTAIGYNPSQYATDNATPAAESYTYNNTHKMVISGVGDGIRVVNNNMYPSDPTSYEIWFTTPSSFATSSLMRLIDDDDDFILSDIQLSTVGIISSSFRTDASNRLVRAINLVGDTVTADSFNQLVITKGAGTAASTLKIYLNGVLITDYQDLTVGTFTGVRTLVGNVVLELPRLNLASGMVSCDQWRQYNYELAQSNVTDLFNLGTPRGLSIPQQVWCVQENLLNGNANADNIGENGVNQGSVSYTTI